MTKKDAKEMNGLYQIGLNKQSESVISAHFMHKVNVDLNNALYSTEAFLKAAKYLDANLILKKLIPILLEASDKFILLRAKAAKTRAKKNFKKFGLSSEHEVGLAEIITEVMFDRQFLKGPKENISRLSLHKKIKYLIAQKMPIKMVILALPYKASSPLKCKGSWPDLAELNFLLDIYEIAKVIDYHYRQFFDLKLPMASFSIVSDGSRFNHIMNENNEMIADYQKSLKWWIKHLAIENYVEILDYQEVMSTLLPLTLQHQKQTIKEQVLNEYQHKMLPLLNVYNMTETINKAIQLDPDPESNNPQGRFIPLFKSLIYIVRYKELTNYAKVHAENYNELYQKLTRHIFEPYIQLSDSDINQIASYIDKPGLLSVNEEKLMEYLRQSMLREAWVAAIQYIGEIRSDRDLPSEPIGSCFKDYIRWTIHAKSGQIALLSSRSSGDTIQAWHGIGLFKESKNHKIKIYSLPRLSLESANAVPVLPDKIEKVPLSSEQPFFYIDAQIKFRNMDQFLDIVALNLIRNRKG